MKIKNIWGDLPGISAKRTIGTAEDQALQGSSEAAP